PEDYEGTNYPADIHVSSSGRFLYGSNRGHNSIVIYEIDEETGRLSMIGHESTHGRIPRNFAIDPNGKFLFAANQESDNIVIFRLDEDTGLLEPTGEEVKVPTPVCIKFLPLP
ncbi:lactonase family protein, partial [Candidatus Bathyarchaeota archaeon]